MEAWCVLRYFNYAELARDGVDAQARIIKRRQTSDTIDVRYRYRLPDGAELTGKESLPDFLVGLQEGDGVKIRYLPRKPGLSYFAENMPRRLRSLRVMLLVPPFCVLILCLPPLLGASR